MGYIVCQLKQISYLNASQLLFSQVNARRLQSWLAEQLEIFDLHLKNSRRANRFEFAKYSETLQQLSEYDNLVNSARTNRPVDISSEIVDAIVLTRPLLYLV